ncbi:MAG TPA: tetratricopeptide repeat protein [Polyangia bacterium]|nr:tetratricopeptide repeat protein [Polyangia bacterium]
MSSVAVSPLGVTTRAPLSGVTVPRSNTRPRNSASGADVAWCPGSWPWAVTPQSVKKPSMHRNFTRVKVHDPHLTTKGLLATVRIRPMRKFSGNFVALLLVGACTMGCDTLKARQVASDAAKLYKEGKIEEAIAKYEEASKLDPNIATIQLNLGFANLAQYQNNPKGQSGDDAANKAVSAFEAFLKLKPGDERGTQYLVQTFVDTSRYDAAVQYYQPKIEKKDPEVFNTLGIIASKTGKFAESKDWYTKRVEADPNNPDAKVSLCVVIWDYLHNHTEIVGDQRKQLADEGIGYCKKAIDQNPKAPNAYTYTNLLYRERSLADITDDEKRPDLEQANAYFKQAMQLLKEAGQAGTKK